VGIGPLGAAADVAELVVVVVEVVLGAELQAASANTVTWISRQVPMRRRTMVATLPSTP
jgi:hypothetical protein